MLLIIYYLNERTRTRMSFRIISDFYKELSFFLALIQAQSTVAYTLMKHFSNCLNTFQLLNGVKLSVSHSLISKEASSVRFKFQFEYPWLVLVK